MAATVRIVQDGQEWAAIIRSSLALSSSSSTSPTTLTDIVESLNEQCGTLPSLHFRMTRMDDTQEEKKKKNGQSDDDDSLKTNETKKKKHTILTQALTCMNTARLHISHLKYESANRMVDNILNEVKPVVTGLGNSHPLIPRLYFLKVCAQRPPRLECHDEDDKKALDKHMEYTTDLLSHACQLSHPSTNDMWFYYFCEVIVAAHYAKDKYKDIVNHPLITPILRHFKQPDGSRDKSARPKITPFQLALYAAKQMTLMITDATVEALPYYSGDTLPMTQLMFAWFTVMELCTMEMDEIDAEFKAVNTKKPTCLHDHVRGRASEYFESYQKEVEARSTEERAAALQPLHHLTYMWDMFPVTDQVHACRMILALVDAILTTKNQLHCQLMMPTATPGIPIRAAEATPHLAVSSPLVTCHMIGSDRLTLTRVEYETVIADAFSLDSHCQTIVHKTMTRLMDVFDTHDNLGMMKTRMQLAALYTRFNHQQRFPLRGPFSLVSHLKTPVSRFRYHMTTQLNALDTFLSGLHSSMIHIRQGAHDSAHDRDGETTSSIRHVLYDYMNHMRCIIDEFHTTDARVVESKYPDIVPKDDQYRMETVQCVLRLKQLFNETLSEVDIVRSFLKPTLRNQTWRRQYPVQFESIMVDVAETLIHSRPVVTVASDTNPSRSIQFLGPLLTMSLVDLGWQGMWTDSQRHHRTFRRVWTMISWMEHFMLRLRDAVPSLDIRRMMREETDRHTALRNGKSKTRKHVNMHEFSLFPCLSIDTTTIPLSDTVTVRQCMVWIIQWWIVHFGAYQRLLRLQHDRARSLSLSSSYSSRKPPPPALNRPLQDLCACCKDDVLLRDPIVCEQCNTVHYCSPHCRSLHQWHHRLFCLP